MSLTLASAGVFPRRMRSVGLAVVVTLLLGCTGPSLPAPRAPVEATPAVVDAGVDVAVAVDAPAPAVDVAGATADAPPASPPRVAAWTDQVAITALAASCDYRPPAPEDGDTGEPDAMLCTANLVAQSCDYDPCTDTVEVPCRVQCGRTCGTCDARCRVGCRQCRAACHDEACVRACATTCGACLERCLDGRDHCLTAGCTRRYEACHQRAVAHYRQGPCLATCTRCQTTCEGRDNVGQCVIACARRLGGCTPTEQNICVWHGVSFGREE